MSSENPRAGSGTGTVVVVVVVVGVLGVLFFPPFGGVSFVDEVARLSNPDATIETTFSSDGTSDTFTATGAPICDAGEVTRKDSGTSATYSWYEDEYQCGAGAFILRGELPLDPDTVGGGESLHGTWLITRGRDDYGDLKGDTRTAANRLLCRNSHLRRLDRFEHPQADADSPEPASRTSQRECITGNMGGS